MTQQFKTTDVLRLEVATPTPGYRNLIPNPSGDLGAWGWITAGNEYEPNPDLWLTTGLYGGDRSLILHQGSARPSIQPRTLSEPIPVTPGDYIKARVDIMRMPTAGSHVAALGLNFYDANHDYIDFHLGDTTETAATIWTSGGQVPAGAAFATVAVNFRESPTGTPDGGTSLLFRRAMLAVSTDPLPEFEFQPPNDWVNILGPSHEITINREDLNVGTMTATILDAALDPSTSPDLRPGKKTRLMYRAKEPVGGEPAEWAPLFTGEISAADVAYDHRRKDERHARITLTAVDAIQRLSAVNRPEGVARISELPYILEGAGVPWQANGRSGHVAAADIVTYNEAASALDQIAITRDSDRGYAWVDPHGVIQIWRRSAYFPTPNATLTDADYSALDVSFSVDSCINEVRFVYLRTTGTETEEVTYGPYRDAASINEWGVHSAEFRIALPVEDKATIDSFADDILFVNGTPKVRANSLTCPINTRERLTRFAPIDIAHELTVQRAGHDDSEGRATAITHTITPHKWIVTFTLDGPGSVAMPQQTPPIQSSIRPDVGVIEMYAGATAPPGRLLCDGASVAVADYPDLHTVIGYTFGGTGDYFNVPDLSDRFPIGVGPKALGTAGGSPTTQIPDHTHNASNLTTNTAGGHNHTTATMNKQNNTAVGGNAVRIVSGTTDWTAGHEHNVVGNTGAVVGANPPVDTMPPWRALNFTIRT